MNIYGATRASLARELEGWGERAAKAQAVYRALYREGLSWTETLASFRPALREKLRERYTDRLPFPAAAEKGAQAEKYLFALEDESRVEAVLMRHPYGTGVCVSSQVGCGMGCAFCESGRLKKVRDLSPEEMMGQVLMAGRLAGKAIDQVVVMGVGEPFDNYENVMTFLEILSDPYGLALGPRHVTVSTSGIVPRMREFAERETPCNLAVSLHAPQDALRSSLMPVNRVYPLSEVMAAARAYARGRRRVAFEYVMLDGVNDSLAQADQLAHLTAQVNGFVNLIPYNPTNGGHFSASPPERVFAFYRRLREKGICATIRREYGGMVHGACGQLRAAKAAPLRGERDL